MNRTNSQWIDDQVMPLIEDAIVRQKVWKTREAARALGINDDSTDMALALKRLEKAGRIAVQRYGTQGNGIVITLPDGRSTAVPRSGRGVPQKLFIAGSYSPQTQKIEWTPERDAMLRELWSDRSLKITDIAEKMDINKHTITRRVHEIGLPSRAHNAAVDQQAKPIVRDYDPRTTLPTLSCLAACDQTLKRLRARGIAA